MIPVLGSLNYVPSTGAWEAFVGGLLTFLAPCVLPMIPIYIMYLTADISQDGASGESKNKVFWTGFFRTLLFVLGFTIIFMLLGLTASSIGAFLNKHQKIIMKIAGEIIIFFGLMMLGVFKIDALQREYRFKAKSTVKGISAVFMGMVFAFGWAPCTGPILGSIMMIVASVSTSMWQGAFLLFIYSMGIAIPFILAYVFLGLFEKSLNVLSKYSVIISKIAGVLLIIFGHILLYDLMPRILKALR